MDNPPYKLSKIIKLGIIYLILLSVVAIISFLASDTHNKDGMSCSFGYNMSQGQTVNNTIYVNLNGTQYNCSNPDKIDILQCKISRYYTLNAANMICTDPSKERWVLPELANAYTMPLGLEFNVSKIISIDGNILTVSNGIDFDSSMLEFNSNIISYSLSFRGAAISLIGFGTNLGLDNSYEKGNSIIYFAQQGNQIYLPYYIVRLEVSKYVGIYLRTSNTLQINYFSALNSVMHTQYGGVIDIVFLISDSIQGIVRDMGFIIGPPKLPTIWALGFSYYSSNNFLMVNDIKTRVNNLRELQLPIDLLWIGDEMWKNNMFGELSQSFTLIAPFINSMQLNNTHIGLYMNKEVINSSKLYNIADEYRLFLKNNSIPDYYYYSFQNQSYYIVDYLNPFSAYFLQSAVDLTLYEYTFDALYLPQSYLTTKNATYIMNTSLTDCMLMLNGSLTVPLYITMFANSTWQGPYANVCNLYNLYGYFQMRSVYNTLIKGKDKHLLGSSFYPGCAAYGSSVYLIDISEDSEVAKIFQLVLMGSIFGEPFISIRLIGKPGPLFKRSLSSIMYLAMLEFDIATIDDMQTVITEYKKSRYCLIPYIYSSAFICAKRDEALYNTNQDYYNFISYASVPTYMIGKSIVVNFVNNSLSITPKQYPYYKINNMEYITSNDAYKYSYPGDNINIAPNSVLLMPTQINQTIIQTGNSPMDIYLLYDQTNHAEGYHVCNNGIINNAYYIQSNSHITAIIPITSIENITGHFSFINEMHAQFYTDQEITYACAITKGPSISELTFRKRKNQHNVSVPINMPIDQILSIHIGNYSNSNPCYWKFKVLTYTNSGSEYAASLIDENEFTRHRNIHTAIKILCRQLAYFRISDLFYDDPALGAINSTLLDSKPSVNLTEFGLKIIDSPFGFKYYKNASSEILTLDGDKLLFGEDFIKFEIDIICSQIYSQHSQNYSYGNNNDYDDILFYTRKEYSHYHPVIIVKLGNENMYYFIAVATAKPLRIQYWKTLSGYRIKYVLEGTDLSMFFSSVSTLDTTMASYYQLYNYEYEMPLSMFGVIWNIHSNDNINDLRDIIVYTKIPFISYSITPKSLINSIQDLPNQQIIVNTPYEICMDSDIYSRFQSYNLYITDSNNKHFVGYTECGKAVFPDYWSSLSDSLVTVILQGSYKYGGSFMTGNHIYQACNGKCKWAGNESTDYTDYIQFSHISTNISMFFQHTLPPSLWHSNDFEEFETHSMNNYMQAKQFSNYRAGSLVISESTFSGIGGFACSYYSDKNITKLIERYMQSFISMQYAGLMCFGIMVPSTPSILYKKLLIATVLLPMVIQEPYKPSNDNYSPFELFVSYRQTLETYLYSQYLNSSKAIMYTPYYPSNDSPFKYVRIGSLLQCFDTNETTLRSFNCTLPPGEWYYMTPFDSRFGLKVASSLKETIISVSDEKDSYHLFQEANSFVILNTEAKYFDLAIALSLNFSAFSKCIDVKYNDRTIAVCIEWKLVVLKFIVNRMTSSSLIIDNVHIFSSSLAAQCARVIKESTGTKIVPIIKRPNSLVLSVDEKLMDIVQIEIEPDARLCPHYVRDM